MTLGHVYDLDLKRNENLIREVIIQAQGEVRMVLRYVCTKIDGFLDGFRRVR
jgi:hypothetical protein